MGEYHRLNRMLEQHEQALKMAEQEKVSIEIILGLQQSIGEIKGALIEMAEVDGFDDLNDAFNY